MQKQLINLICVILLEGCVGHFAMASRLNGIHVGMTKSEVIAIVGEPESIAVTSGVEDFIYVLNASAWDTRMPEPYIVRLTNGEVQSYARKADMPPLGRAGDSPPAIP